ncbi:MAG TPA: tetratricopeptide repeat protein [Steroidobacteraceae bacterium]|nr:tetratricopeptide repeat protein [Steroidobacteraceae bacterium]
MFSSASSLPRRIAAAVLACAAVNIPFAAQADDQPPARQEFTSGTVQHDLSAAIDSAQKRVTAARTEANTKPLQLSDALVALADAEREAGIYNQAEASYREALEIVQKETGPTNSRRLAPLRGLGLTLASQTKHEEAVPYLARALELSRRTDGLFNTGQFEMLNQLATSEAILKDYETAQQHIEYLQKIGEYAYGKRDPRMIPVTCTVADWWATVRAYITARLIYQRAIALGKKTLGSNDLALVRPLRSIARTYVAELVDLSDHASEGIRVRRDSMHLGGHGTDEPGPDPKALSSDGEQALQRAIKILEAHPNARAELADTLLQLGDWYMIKQDRDEAMPVYARVAELAKQDAAAAAALSLPLRLYYPLPPILISSRRVPPGEASERFVLLEYSVTEAGDVSEARVVETNAPARQANQILEALRNSTFRPKFVGSTPVNANTIQYREVYRVRGDEADEQDS